MENKDKRYNNYHKHDTYSNVVTLDVVTKLEEYCERAVELGHTTIFTTNHGTQANIFEATTLGQKYGLKVILGAEGYYVHDRKEKDKTNRHIILVALNDDGAKDINRILSEANISGFYYKPRIDHELLFSINPKNVIVTSACIAGLWNNEELIKECKDYFGDNFFLEVQNHNVEGQKMVNKEVLRLSKLYNIKIIHANDSHYIKPDDHIYRDLFLKAKGIVYEEESNFILDYPDYDTIKQRYEAQGVLSIDEITEAINNTLVFDKAEPLTLVNEEIKLPSISTNPKQELRQMIKDAWQKEKKNIPEHLHQKYIKEILYETDIIEKTHMEDYFIIDSKMVKLAQEKYGGRLTNTGRGSAPSFYVTKLLGLTDMDRIAAPITLFPTRFMSVERILGAHSLPDIDLNTADADPFIKASEELLGAENCAWMIAWKPLQDASAFRLYCKAIGMDINKYNDIAKNLDDFREDEYWKPIIEESKHFIGVIESVSESPCSILLNTDRVDETIGLIRTSTKICCLLDGYNCDKYKYLKNDYLTVTVWAIIKEVCELANIPIPSIKELEEMLDEKVFDVYAKGLTCSINQADSDWATGLVKRYKPRSPAEMSAFVAIIRPGCASLLEDFINRKPYTTGVKELDDLLEDGKHRMIYQELIMKYLIWLGIPETGSYDIIKKIAKKKFKEAELVELKGKLKDGWIKQVGKEEGFDITWNVVEDAARYSFNASHSLSYAYDSLYGAYLKSHYPLEYYTVALNYYSGDDKRTEKLIQELSYFRIKLSSPKFGKAIDKYFLNKQENSIYKGVASIKYMNEDVAKELYNLAQKNKYKNFIDLLLDILFQTSCNSRQLEILIKCNYFSDFGSMDKLLYLYEEFKSGKNRITKTLKDASKIKRIEILKQLEEKAEGFKKVDYVELLRFKIKNSIDYQEANLDYDNRKFFVIDMNYIQNSHKGKATLYQLNTGNLFEVKIKNTVGANGEIGLYDFVNISKMRLEGKWYKDENDKWLQYSNTNDKSKLEYIVYNFEIINKYKGENDEK